MTILRARIVLPVSQLPIEDGAVAVEGDSIVAVGKAEEIRKAHSGEVRDLGDVVLSPGLINAHCHLDYSRFRGEVEWRGSFIEWILQLVSVKQLRTEKEYAAAIQWGVNDLVKSGTTTVVNVESFPQVIDQVPDLGLRVWWCLEMIDFKRTEPVNQLVKEALEVIAAHPKMLGGFALSPHAPYTASADLYRLAAHHARKQNILLTTHLAESEEEDDMIRRGTGHMYDYFIRAGRDMGDCKRQGSAQLLLEYGALGPNCLAVHANCLTPLDTKLLKQSGAHVVHCPKSHRFFGRGTSLLPVFGEQDINVCLGTDSMASNDTLNMFLEMQTLAHVFPRLTAEELLQMTTTNAAKALGQEQKLGKIAPGAWADLIAVPLDGAVPDPYEALVYNEKPVSFSMVGGKVLVG